MKTRTSFLILAAALLAASGAMAGQRPYFVRGNSMVYGGNTELAKASGDTIDLMGPTGSGAPYLGDFEAGWNGWTTADITQPSVTNWQVSGYNQSVAGNLAAWCGDINLASCNDSLDVDGGYGNNWHDLLAYRLAVADPSLSTLVNITATLRHDVEPGYDFVYLSARHENSLDYTDLNSWDGTGTASVNESTTFLPAELVDGTDVVLLFRFKSDGGWSDEDCLYYGAGACQVDDITVTTSQTGQPDIVSFTDFQDGTFGDWAPDFPTGVGRFAALWTNLHAIDPCHVNYTQQVAFIDDGIVVPGTGGSDCINWCYGPGGYIVNTTGGLAGPTSHLHNEIYSPVMSWPNDTYDGIIYAFDVFRHEDLSADAPGMFYTWGIRSADTDGSAGHGIQAIEEQPFDDRSFVYFGGPGYARDGWDVTDLMNQGRDEVQVSFGVYELGWAWGWIGNDGYPAPYFDNVSVKIFPYIGPGMSARAIDLAQDNFPEVDAINLADLGSMHVRFDMAKNISLDSHLRNDPGDSIVVDISPVRTGAVLSGTPELHYTIRANPVFDAYRTAAVTGVVPGAPAMGAAGPVPNKFAFDLPDTGLLFPGDVLHYYIQASDDVGGDIQTATIPRYLTGYGDFSSPLAYDRDFVVHALPTISSDGFGGYDGPPILFWNDFANRGGEAEWYGAFSNNGYVPGLDYDIYYTNGPSSGVGNGIGGRTTGLALAHYDIITYTAGDLGVNTISNGDFNNDPSDDIGALQNWLADGNKGLFITGDDVASDLAWNAGVAGVGFVEDVLGVNLVSGFLRELIGNQATPLVVPVPGNPVITSVADWVAYGGCLGINTFDAVTIRGGATRLAEFTDTGGNPGAYSFSAATLNVYNSTNRVITLPYDLMYVYTTAGSGKVSAPLAARALLLNDVLSYFGAHGKPDNVTSVPEIAAFAVSNAPNPFNPRTNISYSVDKPGHLTLKIYNVRGQLVRTLIDRRVETSGKAMWDGTDDNGQQLASGVYFRQAQLNDKVRIGKMMLIK